MHEARANLAAFAVAGALCDDPNGAMMSLQVLFNVVAVHTVLLVNNTASLSGMVARVHVFLCCIPG